jgi:peptidyl-prolyl cis-trans isomerase A (cyclophilin A)
VVAPNEPSTPVEPRDGADAAPSPPSTLADAPPGPKESLRDPARATGFAPARYRVRLSTSRGDIVVDVQRQWSPNDADRFYHLVKSGFYDDARFYRVVPHFGVQFGIAADSKVNALWSSAFLDDDPVVQSNVRGTVSMARMQRPNSATTQVFINTVDNSRLDAQRYSPFGMIVSGMDVIDRLYAGYGECSPVGGGPEQMRTMLEGNGYLDAQFPLLDKIRAARVE